MANLLHLVVSLAEDAGARQAFGADPVAALAGLDDLTGEDVAAAADVARAQVDPAVGDRLVSTLDIRPRDGEHDRDVAVRALHGICDALDQAGT